MIELIVPGEAATQAHYLHTQKQISTFLFGIRAIMCNMSVQQDYRHLALFQFSFADKLIFQKWKCVIY